MTEKIIIRRSLLQEILELQKREEDLLADREALEVQLLKTEEELFESEYRLETALKEIEDLEDIIEELKDEATDRKMRRVY